MDDTDHVVGSTERRRVSQAFSQAQSLLGER